MGKKRTCHREQPCTPVNNAVSYTGIVRFGGGSKGMRQITDPELMSRFISIGPNCEFGVAQRHYLAEPLDLLRWGSTRIDVLLHMLQDRFRHIADPSHITITLAGGEYMLDNSFYDFTWHTFVWEGQMTADRVMKRELARLPRQAEILLSDLADGERILVRTTDDDTDDEKLQQLAELCASLGPSQILFVSQNADRAGEVERISPTLMYGYIETFADPDQVEATTNRAAWLSICRNAYALTR